MRMLVTGGMGFIGSNFIHLMLNELNSVNDNYIVNLDKITYAGNPLNLKSVENNPQYTFVKGDICNQELVDYIVKKYNITHIVNFAAESHVDRSILNPNIFIDTNVKGTQTLLNVAKNNNIKRFLQVSTDEVYGSLDMDSPAFTENTPISPRSPYSASKASADMLVQAYFHTFHLPVVITRCSNNYGPYQFPEKLIPLMINNILNKKSLPIYGNGKNIRDWIYVEDHCLGILKALIDGNDGEIYNFGGNAEKENIEIVKLLIKELNGSEDLIKYITDRPGHDFRYAMNFSKSKKELNWIPKYNFDNALKKTVKWYTDNLAWVQNIINGDYLKYYETQYGQK